MCYKGQEIYASLVTIIIHYIEIYQGTYCVSLTIVTIILVVVWFQTIVINNVTRKGKMGERE